MPSASIFGKCCGHTGTIFKALGYITAIRQNYRAKVEARMKFFLSIARGRAKTNIFSDFMDGGLNICHSSCKPSKCRTYAVLNGLVSELV